MNSICEIKAPDLEAEKSAAERWNSVAKPLGSLGLLESAIIKIAGIQGTENVDISKRAVAVFCSDNGIVEEGVTQSPSSVTALCSADISDGKSNINALARVYSADVSAYDVGIVSELNCANLVDRKISFGTKNFLNEPAMTIEQAKKAVKIGIDVVRELKLAGYKIIVGGEMGIGNTTSASAISSVLLNLPAEEVTGRGAGLDSAGLAKKISVIKQALELHKPRRDAPLDVISKIGGYDIAALCGLFLGGGIYRVPIVIDGFISAVAANLAVMFAPLSAEFMLASHVSGEPAAEKLLEKIGQKPLIKAEMRLGEGTGGIMLLPLLDGALAVYNSAHSFENLGIERYRDLK